MTYPISHIDGLGADEVKALKAMGIRTTEKLLEAAKDPKGRKLLNEKTKIDEQRLLAFANAADHMRIKGMGKNYIGLLRAAGVNTVRELQYRNPEHLAKAMAEANKKRRMVRFLPPLKLVNRWIDYAKKLPLKITY
jgi:predicted flap endonuclease-1-like 5' DNA nuclease